MGPGYFWVTEGVGARGGGLASLGVERGRGATPRQGAWPVRLSPGNQMRENLFGSFGERPAIEKPIGDSCGDRPSPDARPPSPLRGFTIVVNMLRPAAADRPTRRIRTGTERRTRRLLIACCPPWSHEARVSPVPLWGGLPPSTRNQRSKLRGNLLTDSGCSQIRIVHDHQSSMLGTSSGMLTSIVGPLGSPEGVDPYP